MTAIIHFLNTVERFDPCIDCWEYASPQKTGRTAGGAALIDVKI